MDNLNYVLMKIKKSIIRFWDNLRRWTSYYKVIRKTYDFDYSSLLEVEHHQLIKLRDCISKYQNHKYVWKDIRNMNWAIACLEIILEDGCSYISNEEPPFLEDKKSPNIHIPTINPKYKVIMLIYVNIKNYKRFMAYPPFYETSLEQGNEFYKDRLRIEKAWYLYNKIRKDHLRNWWD